MDLPDADEDLDLTLRHVSRQFPEQLARALLPPGTLISSATWTDTQVTSRQRRLDRALDIVADGRRRFEHTELQLEMAADVPFRIYEYHTLFALALAAETPAGVEVPRIRSTLVLLSGREKLWPEEGEYRTSRTTRASRASASASTRCTSARSRSCGRGAARCGWSSRPWRSTRTRGG